jgi:hypothetical protein
MVWRADPLQSEIALLFKELNLFSIIAEVLRVLDKTETALPDPPYPRWFVPARRPGGSRRWRSVDISRVWAISGFGLSNRSRQPVPEQCRNSTVGSLATVHPAGACRFTAICSAGWSAGLLIVAFTLSVSPPNTFWWSAASPTAKLLGILNRVESSSPRRGILMTKQEGYSDRDWHY